MVSSITIRLLFNYKQKRYLSIKRSGKCHLNQEIWWLLLFLKDFIYLFLERGEGGEKEREISMCGGLSCSPHWGPGLQPRRVPWLGIKPETLWFAAHAQSTELCQPGQVITTFNIFNKQTFWCDILRIHIIYVLLFPELVNWI